MSTRTCPIALSVSIINEPVDTTAAFAGLVCYEAPVTPAAVPTPNVAAVTSCPIIAQLIGIDYATALGIGAHGLSPVLALCRSLVAAGHDPATPLRAFRGDVLCLRVRAIGEAAGFGVSQHGAGFVARHGRRAAPPAANFNSTRPAAPRCGGMLSAPAAPVMLTPSLVPPVRRSPETKPLRVERLTTADMPTGEPQPLANVNDAMASNFHPPLPLPTGAGGGRSNQISAPSRRMKVDISKYAGSNFVKLAHVEPGPIEGRIAGVTQGKYGLNLVLESGDIINLNKTNTRTLMRAWGKNSEDWIAKEVRAFAGEHPYNGGTARGVVLEPISPPLKPDEQTKLAEDSGADSKSVSTDLNDEIPF